MTRVSTLPTAKARQTSRRHVCAIIGALLLAACRRDSDPTPGSGNAKAPPESELMQRPPSLPDKPLVVGESVHAFSALAHNGQLVRLEEFLSGGPVVVYFCPRNRSEQCTTLALSIREHWTDLHAQVGMVFAVSPEPTVVHREFTSEHKLSHLFLADFESTVHGVFGIEPGTVVSYLLGSEGVVRKVFAPPASDHGAEVLQALTELGLRRQDYPI